MQTAVLTRSSYTKLLTDLRRLIEEGKRRAKQAAANELVRTYWEVGKRIKEEKLTENAGYGDSIIDDLARDLSIDVRTLYRCVIFFEQNEILSPRGQNLTWSHYRELLEIDDKKERNWYQVEAQKRDWTRDELARAIKRDAYEGAQSGTSKTKKSRIKRPTEPTYIYKAEVMRVVDGDTLLLRIDLGFQVWKEQRVRLTHVDAPDIKTQKGREAFGFVRDRLARCDFVMVKTNKIDVYGRYLADVFYSHREKGKDKIFKSGRYLNQELLENGLATLV
jgi:endonuclease YncB( thermonuclease family)